MKIYSRINVFDAALDRMRFLFDEFPNVTVSFSGGKDSTVVFNLALIVAKEKNRLPLNVLWIDQEAEWKGTVNYVTSIMERDDVKSYWLQMPMVITNNASSQEEFIHCWQEEKENEWIHPKHELSIKQNDYGEERFHKLFGAFLKKEFLSKSCLISGVRTEENPRRFLGLTSYKTYKHITWGTVKNKGKELYSFYPIYDWSYSDVWKAINNNKWKYNKVYDEMYRYGLVIPKMRISNLHHETALHSLFLIQEIEPDTWNKIVNRINGANTIKHLKYNSFSCPKEFPYMFKSWEEYCYFLIEKLIKEEKNKNLIIEQTRRMETIYKDKLIRKKMYQVVINTILSNDFDLTKIQNFEGAPNVSFYRSKKGKKSVYNLKNPYIPLERKKELLKEFTNE